VRIVEEQEHDWSSSYTTWSWRNFDSTHCNVHNEWCGFI